MAAGTVRERLSASGRAASVPPARQSLQAGLCVNLCPKSWTLIHAFGVFLLMQAPFYAGPVHWRASGAVCFLLGKRPAP